MSELPAVYLVSSGHSPKMARVYLVSEHRHHCVVRHEQESADFWLYHGVLAKNQTTVVKDRAKAVALLLTNLQAAKAKAEGHIADLNATIQGLIDKEGL